MTDLSQNLRLIYVEDEDEFRAGLVSSLESSFTLSPVDVGAFKVTKNGGEIGDQFINWLEKQTGGSKTIDGVILDSDLSGFQNGISKDMLLVAFRKLGIPVCRYSKQHRQTPGERLKQLATLASEGALSVLVPSELTNGLTEDMDERQERLVGWLVSTFKGFAEIRALLEVQLRKEDQPRNAAELMAVILGRPEMELDLVGYVGPSLFFFGDTMGVEEGTDTQSLIARNLATKLGYWFYNFVLAFPGPILNAAATSAFVGVNSKSLADDSLIKAFKAARYVGPFAGSGPYFYRDLIEQSMMEQGKTGQSIIIDSGDGTVCALYEDDPSQAGAYCVATDSSIRREDGTGPFDWIPPGANELCRIEKKTYNRLMPWLNV